MSQRSPIDTQAKFPPVGQRSGDTGTPDLKPAGGRRSDARGVRLSRSLRVRCEPPHPARRQIRHPMAVLRARGCRITASLLTAWSATVSAPGETEESAERAEGLGGGERAGEGRECRRPQRDTRARALGRLSVKGPRPLNNPRLLDRNASAHTVALRGETPAALAPDRARGRSGAAAC